MKRFRTLTALLLVLAMLFTFTGCNQTPAPVETVPTTVPVTEPVVETTEEDRQEELTELYNAAVEALGTEEQAFDISYERTVTVAGLSYSESGKQTLNLWNVGTDELLAKAKETVTYGNNAYTMEWQEIYGNGAVYQTISGGKYMTEMPAEDYLSHCVPAKLLDAQLYTLSIDEAESVIFFEAATAGESWLVPEDAEVISASGTASLNEAGGLAGSSYTVDYRHGAAEISLSYELTVAEAGREPVIPEYSEDYVVLEDASAAYMLEHAYGYLSQAQTLTSDIFNMTASQAAGFYVQESANISVFNQDDTYGMRLKSSVHSTDQSTKESFDFEQTETFQDGKYSTITDEGRPETNAAVTEAMVKSAIENQLLGQIVACEYISSAEITYMDSVMLIEYVCNEDLAQLLCEDICISLFNNSTALSDMASAYETGEMTYYLALDTCSMLPTAAGMKYEGLHTIYGRKYALTQQIDQAFDLGSIDAYKTVYEEFAPEEEPQTPATPLFYHVTGENGQEMWLFGTIHIGDERTAYLPQEIYDAFYASDALAIECNTEAFSDQLDTDEALQKEVSDCYYYSDGSTMEEHIETEDLYEDALKLLKATGNYNPNSPYLKPQLWNSSIDNFYMRQGYSLTYEKGVENRLLELAEEDDMPIREVESSLSQLQMMGNYSDHLQEFLLFNSVVSSAESYWTNSQELYELWCAGDEAALTEELTDEPWELLEEDFNMEDLSDEDLERVQAILADLENINAQLAVLQEEYNKAMSFDRNEHMVAVAKEYLESGETIFYAVGLAHLLAENGLVNGLRAAGYTVELVSFQ